MLPLSHTYVATKVTERKSDLLILGSVLPDIATTSRKELDREKIHNKPYELFEFISKYHPELTDLAIGVILHSVQSGGADFYSDDWQTGYAKLEGTKISAKVAKAFGFHNDERAIVAAHNFIESAVDLHLYNDRREIWEIYRNGIEGVMEQMPKVAVCLSKFLNVDYDVIITELFHMVTLLGPYNFVSKEALVEKTILPISRLRYKIDLDANLISEILDEAIEISAPTYQAYLDNAVAKIRANFSNKSD